MRVLSSLGLMTIAVKIWLMVGVLLELVAAEVSYLFL